MTETKKGSLIIVGTGIDVAGQMTIKAKSQIENADIVFSVVPGKAAMHWLKSLNDNVVPLSGLYAEGKSRVNTYRQMTETMVNAVREGKDVCAAFYGHPGVFVTPSHRAIAQLKAEGYDAYMEPGISAEDCLIADLGIDPGMTGCQAFETSQFLFYKHHIDPSCMIILWQIGIAGEHSFRTSLPDKCQPGLDVLTSILLKDYPADHEVILYEAASLPILPPRIERMPLSDLPGCKPTSISTLVIPSKGLPDFDHETLAKFGITAEDLKANINPESE